MIEVKCSAAGISTRVARTTRCPGGRRPPVAAAVPSGGAFRSETGRRWGQRRLPTAFAGTGQQLESSPTLRIASKSSVILSEVSSRRRDETKSKDLGAHYSEPGPISERTGPVGANLGPSTTSQAAKAAWDFAQDDGTWESRVSKPSFSATSCPAFAGPGQQVVRPTNILNSSLYAY